MVSYSVRSVKLLVEGKGCGSCVAPIKNHLIRHPGVYGVHVRGGIVVVILRNGYTIEEVLGDTGVEMYYWVKILGSGGDELETLPDTPARSYKLY